MRGKSFKYRIKWVFVWKNKSIKNALKWMIAWQQYYWKIKSLKVFLDNILMLWQNWPKIMSYFYWFSINLMNTFKKFLNSILGLILINLE